jgi:hypothetical protein
MLVGYREARKTTRAVFEHNTCNSQGFKTNLSRSVQAHRVSRNPGGDFRRISGILFMVDRAIRPHFIEQPRLDDVQSVVVGASTGRGVGR